MRPKTDITAADWSIALESWVGMIHVLSQHLREEREHNGWLSAFLNAVLGIALVVSIGAVLFLTLLILCVERVQEAVEQGLVAKQAWAPTQQELPVAE